MSQKVQLALQGGGAKIALLIAAMEAIEELQGNGALEVTRIAGTSAGAIVGCLFAAGVPMGKVRDRLRNGLGEKLLRTYRAPSVSKVIRQATPLIGGSPFWDESHLRVFLAEFFDNPDIKLNELKKPMIVMSANITDLRAFSHKDDDYVISAITNSCGLPFCFRTWSRGGGPVLVDGGICENLPTEVLEKNADQYGPIAAISFEQQVSYAPRDVIGFTKALLDTAINNSITRARGALPPNSVYTIKTSISTFDFQKALDTGLNEEYKAVKAEALNWFQKFAERNQNLGISDNPWADLNPAAIEMMKKLGLVYDAQHAPVKFKYTKCGFEVRANCLLEKNFKGAAHLNSPDWFKYELEFEPLDKPIECISIAITPTNEVEFLGVTKGEVWGGTKDEEITPITAPAFNPDDNGRELMLFFNPVLQAGTGSYHLRFQDEGMQLMKPLLTDKKDVLEFYPRRAAGNIGRIDLILHVPEELKDEVKLVARAQPVPGRIMTAAERAQYDTPPGFYTLGWTGENVAVEDNFGVDVIYQK